MKKLKMARGVTPTFEDGCNERNARKCSFIRLTKQGAAFAILWALCRNES